jgi:hypothetical protein
MEAALYIDKGISAARRPFPGKFPTRVWVFSSPNALVPFSYTGKPTSELKSLVRKQYFLKGGEVNRLNFYEFDQNGIIIRVQNGALGSFATFFRQYLPFALNLLMDLGSRTLVWLLLDRVVETVSGNKMYVCPAFRNGPTAAAYRRDIVKCARGHVDGHWPGRVVELTLASMNNQIREYYRTTRPVRPQINAVAPQIPVPAAQRQPRFAGRTEQEAAWQGNWVRLLIGEAQNAMVGARVVQEANPQPAQANPAANGQLAN